MWLDTQLTSLKHKECLTWTVGMKLDLLSCHGDGKRNIVFCCRLLFYLHRPFYVGTIMAKKENRVRAQRDHNQWTNFLVAK